MDTRGESRRFNLRLSIKGMLLFTVAAAFGAGALRSSSAPWACAWASFAVLCLFVSILTAIYCRGMRKAFWTGFAICGGGYFLFVVTFRDSEIVGRLATNQAIYAFCGKTNHDFAFENGGMDLDRRVQAVGHSECALLFGLIGGLLASALSAKWSLPMRRGKLDSRSATLEISNAEP